MKSLILFLMTVAFILLFGGLILRGASIMFAASVAFAGVIGGVLNIICWVVFFPAMLLLAFFAGLELLS